ncbi:hypothetical protein ABLN97_06740 [Mycobacterium tuberculosis]
MKPTPRPDQRIGVGAGQRSAVRVGDHLRRMVTADSPTDLADQFGRHGRQILWVRRPFFQSPAGGFLNADQFSAEQQILQRRQTDEARDGVRLR